MNTTLLLSTRRSVLALSARAEKTSAKLAAGLRYALTMCTPEFVLDGTVGKIAAGYAVEAKARQEEDSIFSPAPSDDVLVCKAAAVLLSALADSAQTVEPSAALPVAREAA